MSKPLDVNDRLQSGSLPDNPHQGELLSDDVPRIYSARDLLTAAYDAAHPKAPVVYGTTGHHRLDTISGGLRPGDCWLIGADTSWGKSSFAIMIYDENRLRSKRVLIVSAEDSLQTYGERLMCRRTRIPASTLRARRFEPGHHHAMAQAQHDAELDAVFIDARGRQVEWLVPRVKTAIREHAIDVVIFDYVGAFECRSTQEDRRNMTRYIGRTLTDLVKTSGVCGVIMSQLTLSEEEKVPGKYAIRDCKDLVHMSEVTLIGFRAPDDKAQYEIKKGDRVVSVAKCKNGPAGDKVKLNWHDAIACFDADWDPEQRRYSEMFDERRYQ